MVIYCDNLEDMVKVCVLLLKQGVGFDANSLTFKIELTGGY